MRAQQWVTVDPSPSLDEDFECTVSRMKSALTRLPLAIVLSLAACGGAASNAAPNATAASTPEARGAGGAGKAADRCLAVAGAKHERKPDEPSKITVKHVLVKYVGAKKAAEGVARTREQACLRAEEARSKLEQGTPFADVVRTYSEEQGAATREGTLGSIQRTDVVPPFADAAFELRSGEVSQVVETDFGFHLILRVE